MFFVAIVSSSHAFNTILFIAFITVSTIKTCINETTNSTIVSHFEFCHLVPDLIMNKGKYFMTYTTQISYLRSIQKLMSQILMIKVDQKKIVSRVSLKIKFCQHSIKRDAAHNCIFAIIVSRAFFCKFGPNMYETTKFNPIL